MPSQRYAIDGAIQIKSVEENVQKVEVLLVTVQNNKMGEKLPFTVTNIYKGEVLPSTIQNKQGN